MHPHAIDVAAHRAELSALLRAIDGRERLDGDELTRLLRRHPKAGRGLFAKADLVAAYCALGAELALADDEATFLGKVRLKPIRSVSGVTPVTILTKPYPCPGECIFCPTDVRMPKSYLSDEPGAQRAALNGFDPYRQTRNRLDAFERAGHPTDKVELLILGGTWSAYPACYQRWFVTRSLDALQSHPPERGDAESASWEELEAAQEDNEHSTRRMVGLTLETRPDHVTEAEVVRLRRLGATRIQLGAQSLDDAVLARNQRGHDVAATRTAVTRLRRAGFKLLLHWMPNLMGATPASDRADLARLFADPALCPDELKVYPTVLVETAALVREHAAGHWRPYDDDTLTELLADCLAAVPRYCRVTRVIRDIPATDIVAGTHTSNLREVAERRLAARGQRSVEIRGREIRAGDFDPARLELCVTAYLTAASEERFLELVTPDDRLVAFLRLSLPSRASFLTELGDCAIVREIHVYGRSLPLGGRDSDVAQHRGLGARLLEEAARAARAAGRRSLAVISSVGTRAYYRRRGFVDGELYQHRDLG